MMQSNALWPVGVCSTKYGNNISSDTHKDSYSAKAICAALEREGFGGNRKEFPIATWVSDVQECPHLPPMVQIAALRHAIFGFMDVKTSAEAEKLVEVAAHLVPAGDSSLQHMKQCVETLKATD